MWHAQEQALYWVDIVGCRLHRLEYGTQQHQEWKMPGKIGCVAPRESGGLIAGIDDEICFIDLPSGKVSPQVMIPDQLRLNDGKCDVQGRFWIGTVARDTPQAHLYRFDPDGRLHTMQDQVFISNGMAWSLDNQNFYYTDSVVQKIYVYHYDSVTGTIDRRRTLIEVDDTCGFPDGMTIDSEGFLWSACWDGGKIIRYTPQGMIDREIKMPVQRPTSCAFGGPNLDILYVTTCSRDENEASALPEPAGSLYALDVGVKGLETPMFRG